MFRKFYIFRHLRLVIRGKLDLKGQNLLVKKRKKKNIAGNDLMSCSLCKSTQEYLSSVENLSKHIRLVVWHKPIEVLDLNLTSWLQS